MPDRNVKKELDHFDARAQSTLQGHSDNQQPFFYSFSQNLLDLIPTRHSPKYLRLR